MSTFRIGDFLTIEGPLRVDLQSRTVTGFHHASFTQAGTALQFDASVEAHKAPLNVPTASTLTWEKGAAASTGNDGIELKVDGIATLSFHWPNPLTPRSDGLFFRLAVVRTKNGYRLKFKPGEGQPEAVRAFGYGYFFDAATTFFFLAERQSELTLDEWRSQWLNSVVGKVTARDIQSSALFQGDDSSLIDDRPNKSAWAFGWRFVPATGASRAIAAVDIDDETFAVSARALRLEERGDLRPRPLRWSGKLAIRCAALRPPGTPASWAVDWLDVPTFDKAAPKDRFSLRTFWQELTRHWPLGLRSLRSRNALTFFPSDITADTGRWTFRYRCDRTGSGFRTHLTQIGCSGSVVCHVELGAVLQTIGKAGAFDAPLSAPLADLHAADVSPVPLLHAQLSSSTGGLGQLMVGGLVLEAGALGNGSIRLEWVPARTELGQPSLAADIRLNLQGGAPRPGTTDAERGFESENDLLDRERPIVIDLQPGGRDRTAIEVREEATGQRSRVLEIAVRSAQHDFLAGAADVVVIDPAPLLVARAITTGTLVAEKTILAAYRDDGDQPAGWELHTNTGTMALVLAPQAIGEEMIKGNLTVLLTEKATPVPFRDRPFDFRLSPPALLTLDRTDVATARAPAPWSLRRLLDRRLGVVGLKLDAARFELLYGLTSTIQDAEGLRVAEQDAFIGRIPIAPALRDRASGRLLSIFTKAEIDYAIDAVSWIRGIFRRPAQLPVFRDAANRERLVVSDGAAFAFRPSRQTAHPLRLNEPAHASVSMPEQDTGRLRLRGGADFAFESQNIYESVIDNPTKAAIRQPQGLIAGLVFGALGGSGSQQAGFDEGRSMLITETTHGRLNSLTLIRIGRIAMLWHQARHVIVYERTTRTAPRYVHEQPGDFEGLAALRKVKEYVEITQPRRSYPDFPVDDDRPSAGPITGVTFETHIIPVRSSWGYDIKDGWVMALRGPMRPDEAPFYPMPKIFFELARAEAKGGGAINHLAADPSQLLFFTTTGRGLGADTDTWPAWPDVDFPLTRRAEPPKVPYLPGFTGSSHQPNAAEHDYGQRRFTIDVVPPEEAANLLHGRPGKGLEARVRNVSLLRAGAAAASSPIDATVGKVFAAAEAQITDSLAELAQHLERVAVRNSAAAVAEVDGLRAQARTLLVEVQEKAVRLKTAVKGSDDALKSAVDNWTTLQARRLKSATEEGEAARAAIATTLSDQLKAVVAHLKGGKPVDAAKVSALSAIESACRQARERLERVPFLGAEVRERFDAVLQQTANEVASEVARIRGGWIVRLDEVLARLPAEGAAALYSELLAGIMEGRAQLVAFGSGFGRLIKTRLGPLFGDVAGDAGAVGRLTAAVEALVAAAVEGIDEAIEEIPPFAVVPPDRKAILELFDGIFPDPTAAFVDIAKELLDPLKAETDKWDKALAAELDKLDGFCRKGTKDLLDAIDKGAAALEALIATTADAWKTTFRDGIDALAKDAKTRLDELVKNVPAARQLEGGIDRIRLLEKEVEIAAADLQSAIDGAAKDVRQLADQANEAARRAGAGLRRIGEQIEQAVANELRDVVTGKTAAALELTRAFAEGPITDSMRCTRDWLGYYYDAGRDALDVTRAASVFNDRGGSVLNALSAQVPFDRIRDRILAQLGGFDVNRLFPDFAGLKLEHLLSGMRIPTDGSEYDWIKMRHGFDRDRLKAWSEIVIDKRFDDSPELFTLPPVALSVVRPRFAATSRIEADATGVRTQRTQAKLTAHWMVTLNGQLIMSIEDGGLYFDSDGGFHFDFEPDAIRLAPALEFVTDALKELFSPDDGVTVTPLVPGGISVELSLPLPDIGSGVFTLTGITLYTHFDLLVATGFEVRIGAWLSRPERPFGMAILFLGGGGWFGVDVRYRPPDEFETRVSVGLAAGAFVALNFGVARGSAGILFTVGLDFYRNWLQSGSQDVAISIGILVWGEFSILSIVSAYIRVILRVEYRNGSMTGYGMVSVSIKICWCFTLRVDAPIRLPFAGGSRRAAAARPAARAVAAAKPPMSQVLDAHFKNLDV